MLAHALENLALWGGFLALIAVILVADLKFFNKGHQLPSTRKSVYQVVGFVAIALLFGLFLLFGTHYGATGAAEYYSGYLTEWSLSIDNLFVLAIIMKFFGVPRELHHKVLTWGILGALVMRFIFIVAGMALLNWLTFLVVLLGCFLIYTGYMVITSDDEEKPVTELLAYRIVNKILGKRSLGRFHEDKFFVKVNGTTMVTLMLVVVAIAEITDLFFAVDSVPIIFSITDDPFIAFSSNMMAILGLRSIFFLYGKLEDKLSWLNEGLGTILAVVGVTLILGSEPLARAFEHLGHELPEHVQHIPVGYKLGFIASVLAITAIASIFFPKAAGEEVNLQEVVNPASDDVMVELCVATGYTMKGEWDNGLVRNYALQTVRQFGHFDTDKLVPMFGFADRVAEMPEVGVDYDGDFRRPELGNGCRLELMLQDAATRAKQTTGKYIIVILTDGQVDDERAVRQAFTEIPDNMFVVFVRVSDEPGGAEFLAELDVYNVAEGVDRCHTIQATDNRGMPLESIEQHVGDEVKPWLASASA